MDRNSWEKNEGLRCGGFSPAASVLLGQEDLPFLKSRRWNFYVKSVLSCQDKPCPLLAAGCAPAGFGVCPLQGFPTPLSVRLPSVIHSFMVARWLPQHQASLPQSRMEETAELPPCLSSEKQEGKPLLKLPAEPPKVLAPCPPPPPPGPPRSQVPVDRPEVLVARSGHTSTLCCKAAWEVGGDMGKECVVVLLEAAPVFMNGDAFSLALLHCEDIFLLPLLVATGLGL